MNAARFDVAYATAFLVKVQPVPVWSSLRRQCANLLSL
jgi:hypothetical protein